MSVLAMISLCILMLVLASLISVARQIQHLIAITPRCAYRISNPGILMVQSAGGHLGRVRRNTLICCLKTRTSASSATRDRSRSITIPKISLHKSNIEQQHRPILDQPPAGWGLRQGHPVARFCQA